MEHDIKTEQINLTRRRLAKGGLAAPVVLSTLASRSVLGNTNYHCTTSGKLSGNTSAHPQDLVCNGQSSSHWASTPITIWPSGGGTCSDNGTTWINENNNARQFRNTPKCLAGTAEFEDAYVNTNNSNPASVLRVMAGTVAARSGFYTDIRLGKEAVTAVLNAMSVPDFPLSAGEVVTMFNDVVNSPSKTQVKPGVYWGPYEVLQYFTCINNSSNGIACPVQIPPIP